MADFLEDEAVESEDEELSGASFFVILIHRDKFNIVSCRDPLF
jgi:hypothetical protein